jgi:hypothetical protein
MVPTVCNSAMVRTNDVPSEVELLVQDGEVDDGDDDLHDGDEGGHEHGPPLLDAPCHQHERHAAPDDALVGERMNK